MKNIEHGHVDIVSSYIIDIDYEKYIIINIYYLFIIYFMSTIIYRYFSI